MAQWLNLSLESLVRFSETTLQATHEKIECAHTWRQVEDYLGTPRFSPTGKVDLLGLAK